LSFLGTLTMEAGRSSKRWCLCTSLHCVMFHKNGIFSVSIIENIKILKAV
jgi:hypothetical protein